MKKPRGIPFKKGCKAGPGRTRGTINGATRAKEYLEKEGGWKELTALVESKDESIRLRTLEVLLERAYGKAPQSVKLGNDDGGKFLVRVEYVGVPADGRSKP